MLGLAGGAGCLGYCAPVLMPVMLSEAMPVRRNLLMLGQFLSGRLTGYALFGVAAWAAGRALPMTGTYRPIVTGAAYVALAALLCWYVLRPGLGACVGRFAGLYALAGKGGRFAALGLLTGISPCPPLLLAMTAAANEPNLAASVMFFVAFFAGTSVYIAPLCLVGLANRFAEMKVIGRLAAGVVGVYYLWAGLVLFAGGLMQP